MTNIQSPFRSLINGKDLEGWSLVGSNGKACVQDGEMVCHMVSNTPEHTFVRSDATFSDFVLELDCKLTGDFHTGVLFRCTDATDTEEISLYGYQVKIDPTLRKWTGGVFDDFGGSWNWLYDLKDDARARDAFKMMEWNHFRIEAIGSHIKVWVNEIPTTNMINHKYRNGYIALKIHSLGNSPEKENILVHYKNIHIITENPEQFIKEIDIPNKTVDTH